MSGVELYAPSVYKALNGVFCVYKPTGQSVFKLVHTLQLNLARDLNKMPCRPPRQRVLIGASGNTAQTDITAVTGAVDSTGATAADTADPVNGAVSDDYESLCLPSITTDIDLSDHPLVVGPRYVEEDFRLSWVNPLSSMASGVQVMAVGRGCSLLPHLKKARLLRAYHVKGEFGTATHDFTSAGRIIEKTTYKHVTRALLDRVVAAMQAGHQKHMYTAAGVDIQSQAAYELACQGLLRPAAVNQPAFSGPVLYDIRCIQFKPPVFTLEIHAANETCAYLMKLIHEIGLELRSSAVCTGLRRLRYGQFTLSHTLLDKHCEPRAIAENIDFCRPLVMEACRRGERSNIIQTTNVDDAEAAVERYKIDKQGGDVDHEDYADSDSDDETSLPDVSRRKY